jgi:hypothetical protein
MIYFNHKMKFFSIELAGTVFVDNAFTLKEYLIWISLNVMRKIVKRNLVAMI